MSEKVVYSDALVSTIDAARGRITPKMMERLKAEAGYDDQVKRSAYPIETLDGVVKVLARELFPGLPLEQAQFEVGVLAMKQYGDSLVGKALVPLMRLLGPMKFLKRLPQMFRQANNYADVAVEVTGPSTFLLDHNEVSAIPHYFRGVMQASVAIIGLKDPRCELLSYDGHRAKYAISWKG